MSYKITIISKIILKGQKMQHIKDLLHSCSHLLITAGAGMSADSGLPTYRDKEGFWRQYPALKELNIDFEEIATPSTFLFSPSLAWAFYAHRYNLYANATPHEGYSMLLEFAKGKKSFFVLTSNVDSHFLKAGFPSQNLYECHGNIEFLQCRCTHELWRLKGEIKMNGFEVVELPKCPFCGSVARPNILMFNDWDFNDERECTQAERFHSWKKALNQDELLLILEIGAGVAIPTIRNMGEKLASSHPNAKLIRINPQDAQIPKNLGYSLRIGALEGIKSLLDHP